MYNNLFFGVKRRILEETESAFLNHPAFSEKVKVYNKFPFESRIQYGCVLRSTSGSQVRMSADNYMADTVSHVRLARDRNNPGYAIEWARENALWVTRYQKDEDVSSQVGPTQRQFFTSKPIVSGPGNTTIANNPGLVKVTINDSEILPEFVDGAKGLVLLQRAVNTGDVVKVSYYYRYIDLPGIYVIDFTEDTQFTVGPIYIVEDELVIESTTGTETTANLAHTLVDTDTDELYVESYNGGLPIRLERGTDYTITYATGEITFLTSLPAGRRLRADYRYQPGNLFGPFTFQPYQEVHDAIKGVVISIGRRAKKGDRQVIVVSESREQQAKVYGGHWEMGFSVAVVAKDPMQMEEMTDQLVNHFWAIRKNLMEFEGITLNSVEPSGETEEPFIETTGEQYYESSVEISVMTEWQRFIPYLYKIRHIFTGIRPYEYTSNFRTDSQGNMIYLEADTREVIKYPTVGYERVI